VVLAPADVLHRFVDVVEEDLRLTAATRRIGGHEVGEPAVVRADAGQAELEVLGAGCRCDDHARGEERRHGVREHDLGRHALGVEIGVATVVVPVAAATVVLQVAEGVLVLAPPRVEGGLVLGGEVLAVLGVVATCVAVGRDDRVAR
jgi:hypothetical protein